MLGALLTYIHITLRNGHTDIWFLRGVNRSVPTKEQILVPETLLKKRKANEKSAEDRATAAETRKKVCSFSPSSIEILSARTILFDDDTYLLHED